MRVCRSTHVSFHLTLRCGSAHQCACVYMRVCVFICRFPREDLALEPVQMVMWWLVRVSEEAPPGLDFMSARPKGGSLLTDPRRPWVCLRGPLRAVQHSLSGLS